MDTSSLKRCGIYAIANKVNSKLYVGSAKNIHNRWSRHHDGLRHNCHHSQKLQNAWNKYGAEAFFVFLVEAVEVPEELIIREQFWIDKFGSFEGGYNACPTAGSPLGRKATPETRAKQSALGKSRPGYVDPNKGRKLTPEHIARSQAGRGVVLHSAETRAKISASRTGITPKYKDPEGRLAKITASHRARAAAVRAQ